MRQIRMLPVFLFLCVAISFCACGRAAFADASVDEARIVRFVQSFGWDVDPQAVESALVTLPDTPNVVWDDYNRLQRSQGFDFAPYYGKTVMKYVFPVRNYPGYENDPAVRADVFVCDGVIVGGDVCRVALDGFIHGFLPQKTDYDQTG